MSGEEVSVVSSLVDDFQSVLFDVYRFKDLYDKWADDDPFVDPAVHIDYDVVTTVPSAGDLNQGEVRFGDGTGPNGRDEIFISVDGSTVARFEADSIIS